MLVDNHQFLGLRYLMTAIAVQGGAIEIDARIQKSVAEIPSGGIGTVGDNACLGGLPHLSATDVKDINGYVNRTAYTVVTD